MFFRQTHLMSIMRNRLILTQTHTHTFANIHLCLFFPFDSFERNRPFEWHSWRSIWYLTPKPLVSSSHRFNSGWSNPWSTFPILFLCDECTFRSHWNVIRIQEVHKNVIITLNEPWTSKSLMLHITRIQCINWF